MNATAAAPSATFTPEDLLRLSDSVSYELVNGRLVERHSSMACSAIAVRIGGLLGGFLRGRKQSYLFDADAGYQCFPDAPNTVRKADLSFVRSGRFPGNRVPKGHSPIPPDLAVEVLSPNDLAYEVEEKVAEYLGAGVPLVWVVSPNTRTVRIHRPRTSPQGSISELAGDDVITGEDVLPGFSCPVSEFFPSP